MSTICKLDPNVRIDRYLRKKMLRAMRGDLATITDLVRQGHKTATSDDYKRFSVGAQFKHDRLLKEMIVRRTVTHLMVEHIAGICRDPARTGARKEAILAKLGVQT